MSKNSYVLVYDSGVGGLTTLKTCIDVNKTANFIYFADHKNCPYGTKSPETLLAIILENIKTLRAKYHIRALVLACNTATTACIKDLRDILDIPVIGTEPNLKSAEKNGFEHTTLIATPLTLKQNRIKSLVLSQTTKVHTLSTPRLASMIENYVLNGTVSAKSLQYYVRHKFKYTPKFHAVVLGCTHYVFIKDYLENTLGYTCFDGNLGVAQELKRVLSSINYSTSTSRLKFESSTLPLALKIKKAYLKYARQQTKLNF